MNSPHSIYLIRHAQSEYNVYMELAEENKINLLDYKFTEELIDCNITPKGEQQAEEAHAKIKDCNVTLVLVSPLRRALNTAHHIFKNHPNRPKFIAWPILREVLDSACDVPDDIEVLKKEFPEVDFSEFDKFENKDMWLLETIENETIKKDIKEGFAKVDITGKDRGKEFRRYFVSRMKEAWPNTFEFGYDIVTRCVRAREMLKEKAAQMKEGEKIAVVTHSALLKRFVAKNFDETGYPVEDYMFKNCEIYEFIFQ